MRWVYASQIKKRKKNRRQAWKQVIKDAIKQYWCKWNTYHLKAKDQTVVERQTKIIIGLITLINLI